MYHHCEAGPDHWQPIIRPGSLATGNVALTDVAPVPPEACVPPYVDFHLTATGETLSGVDTELKLAGTSNVEPSPTQATLSDSGDQADEVHFPVLDSLEGCTCLACAQERHPIIVPLAGRWESRVHCRIPQCTFLVTYTTRISLSKYHAFKTLCRHEGTHFEHQGKYKCAETDCDCLAKQFRDLKRHYRAKHCTKTPGYPCDVLGCKYGGENGFHRKDKLASHYKNMHQGRVASVAHRRKILPAPAKNEDELAYEASREAGLGVVGA